MKPLLLTLLAIAPLLTGCATRQYAPAAGQNVIYTNGSPMLVSSKKRTSVSITPLSVHEGKARFAFSIANFTPSPLMVYHSQVSAVDSSGKRIKVFSAREMEQEARRQANMMALAGALNAAGQSMQASAPSTTYHSGSIQSTSSPYSSANYSGVSTTYNPAQSAIAQQQIRANSSRNMEAIAQNLNNNLNEASNVFDTTTIFPSRIHSCMLVTKTPQKLSLKVNIENEAHEFQFVLQ